MRRYLMSVLILVPLGAPAARADFVAPASRSTAPALPSTAPDAPVAAPSEASSPAASMEPRFKIAQGFGDHVPLSFAVRQIVPRAVRVTYGPGADPDVLVEWKGGEGWNRVLFRAVHPLGLRLVMTYMAVQIRK
jgi:hypothetical protein